MENWKDIVGYEGLYQVSDLGRIKNGKGDIITPWVSGNRYLRVGLRKEGKRTFFKVHRLVWEAFNGPIPEGLQVNHIDEDPGNNALINLNLLSPKENTNWGTGKERSARSRRKMVAQYTLDGVELAVWFSVKGIEEEFGYNRKFIANCCRQLPHYNSAYGYIWKYVG